MSTQIVALAAPRSSSVQTELIPYVTSGGKARVFLKFGFNRPLLDEIKESFEDRKYHGFDDAPDRQQALTLAGTYKVWSIPMTQRNIFRLAHLSGKKPYAIFDAPMPPIEFKWDLREKQKEMVVNALRSRVHILAAEPGCGKTLTAFEIMHQSGISMRDWEWVGPKGSLVAIILELRKWGVPGNQWPKLMSYEAFTKRIREWPESHPDPTRAIVFDEADYLKNPDSNRSGAAKHLADAMREAYGFVFQTARDRPWIILMSGTPAPKRPTEWHPLCEIACPGFLRENKYAFEERIAYKVKDASGYPKITGYNPAELVTLGNRMKGLVTVVLKKDFADLPEKVYVQLVAQPAKSTIRLAQLVLTQARNNLIARILLRELSDGFQYEDVETDKLATCTKCNNGRVPDLDEDGKPIFVTCRACNGTTFSAKKMRSVKELKCPKDELFIEELESHRDSYGRYAIFAAFTGTIDRLQSIALAQGWHVIRMDGTTNSQARIFYSDKQPTSTYCPSELHAIEWFQLPEKYPSPVCFIAHAESGGRSLTLTATPTLAFFSNDFKPSNRQQAEERNGRIGSKGRRIVDFIHLESDRAILKSILTSTRDQALTMEDLERAIQAQESHREVVEIE